MQNEFQKILEFLLLVPKKQDDITLLSEWEWVKARHLRVGDELYNGEVVMNLMNNYGSIMVYANNKYYDVCREAKVKIKRRF